MLFISYEDQKSLLFKNVYFNSEVFSTAMLLFPLEQVFWEKSVFYVITAIIVNANTNRQVNNCNNLASRVILFVIVSKSSVGQTISNTVLPHFSKNPVAQIPMTSLSTVTTKIVFQTCLNYMSFGCSLCTDQFLKTLTSKCRENEISRQIQIVMAS